MLKNKLSVVIISKNEENFIEDAVKSASFANEVLILDSGSSDRTCNIAKKLGAKVEYQEWLGFGKQKQKAVELASNDWVFVLDSDERFTSDLQKEILKLLSNPEKKGYFVPRLNNFWGKDIKSCGLYPDYSLRLFNRNSGRFNDREVHESVIIEDEAGYLKNHMKHLAYDNIEQFINKQNKYSSLSQKKKNIFKAMINPYWTFFKLFIIKKGFLDGWDGFIISKLYAQYTFWKYIK
ncbi:MAG: glycosyltransferase family 2 protein [Campylobacteraceae bacterium]|nr:glycosyltransferase family 2 protein [Campylobacteraceae bacterium]MBT4179320.1 glycosyltransferase family 2 protein [Campylobacteraceae bacterium]MBT4571839.1 glycosyltransferase family 2 protein [Campylobacteraceae bacterium]MBT4707452.1 glycosyltransferase family 2 protein [Campylobacteraceae bacterium]MBT5983349.1 glycosyltransferase family 2 protein [Campylobacteraceae bacterium]